MARDLTESITAIMQGETPEKLDESVSGYSANELTKIFSSRMKQQLNDFMDIQSGKKDATLEMKSKAYQFRKEFGMDFMIPLETKNPKKDGRFKKVSAIPGKNPSIERQIFAEDVELTEASGESADAMAKIFSARMKQQVKDFTDIMKGKKNPTPEMATATANFRRKFGMDFVIPLKSKNPMKDGGFKSVSLVPIKHPSLSQQIFSEETVMEDSGSKEKYQKFFQSMLKKSEFDSVEDMSDQQKKKFFNMVDKKWNADDEAGKDGLTEDGGCEDCKKEDCECGKSVTKEERMIDHLEAISEALLEKWSKKKGKKEDVNIDIDADDDEDDDEEKSDDDKEEKDSEDKKEKKDEKSDDKDEKVKLDKKKEKVNKDPELKEDLAVSIKRIKDLLDA